MHIYAYQIYCMIKERTTITLPRGYRVLAHAYGLNISRLAADAITSNIQEKETGVPAAKQSSPAVTLEERHNDSVS